MAKSKKLKLSELLVNTENYRFDPVVGQKEAIDTMVEDQGEKLIKLAEHIVANGLNPNDRIQVIPSNHDKAKYNVVEGNRRTVTLKLLNNPDLLDDSKHATLKRKFKKLQEDNKEKLINAFECTIYDNPAEADKWIKLKHAGALEGAGTVTWNAQQIDRFEEKFEGKSSIVLQTIKLLEKSGKTPPEVKSNLKKLKSSNLERLISDPSVREFLGVDVNDGVLQSQVNEDEVIKGLVYIVKALLEPSFKVNKIYRKEDREDFLRKIPKTHRPDIDSKSKKPWKFTGDPSTPAPVPPKPKPNPRDRENLIPKSCSLKIDSAKVNYLYHELKMLSVNKYTNVAAVAFRVFVESSMDCYIERNKLTKSKDGKTILSKDSKLMKKVVEVANHLEDNNLAHKSICKGIRSAISNKHDLLGIETLHAYVHNDNFSAIPKNMVITWDNIQPFIEKVWENIK